ncbi:MAG: FAD-dependent oxidoreductase [Chthonomonadales bacterium]|nr:FAD-dependent oxidoreductase [Chthonomonadales bacterium]
MRKYPASEARQLRTERIEADLAVVGGGMAGVCCAITAARQGVSVALIQDRPVLGGNASSEVRLWVLGATAHMTNNNRWAREGGVLDELLVENLWRNREGNPVIFDTILLERVIAEKNITLLLNTAVHGVRKQGDRIASVSAFCSQNSTAYEISAPLFCDASGDGIVGFLAGAPFRVGAEKTDEFGEKFAPDPEAYGELLGHSIYFYSKDTGKPVTYVAPTYALKDITQIPRFGQFNAQSHGCRLWWIEWGGRLDTVHDTEKIKWELWKVVFGVWDYVKNSGKFPEAANLTLEWAGLIPGKRESRRFEGTYMLTQQDIIEQRQHEDAVAHGGWSIDLHPADGIYSPKPGCNQWHARGVYGIPYRCLYSRSVPNLFLAGRIISASHVAFGSTRVMATCAAAAQAVGMAASLCKGLKTDPAALSQGEGLRQLQTALVESGQHIPEVHPKPTGLEASARVTASSSLRFAGFPSDGPLIPLSSSWAQMIPVPAGPVPAMTVFAHADRPTTLRMELRETERAGNHVPDRTLAAREVALPAGQNLPVRLDFGVSVATPRYVYLCAMKNPDVALHGSDMRLTGVLSLRHRYTQQPTGDIGVEVVEMWCPDRRPGGHNMAIELEPALDVFGPGNAANGISRPTVMPNAWVADPADPRPSLTLAWGAPQAVKRIVLEFDTDFDHPMESVQHGHPERAAPFCVRRFRVLDGLGHVVADASDNHQTRAALDFDPPLRTGRITVELLETHGNAPPALFGVRCYGP